jgi:hypothetical protein
VSFSVLGKKNSQLFSFVLGAILKVQTLRITPYNTMLLSSHIPELFIPASKVTVLVVGVMKTITSTYDFVLLLLFLLPASLLISLFSSYMT